MNGKERIVEFLRKRSLSANVRRDSDEYGYGG